MLCVSSFDKYFCDIVKKKKNLPSEIRLQEEKLKKGTAKTSEILQAFLVVKKKPQKEKPPMKNEVSCALKKTSQFCEVRFNDTV